MYIILYICIILYIYYIIYIYQLLDVHKTQSAPDRFLRSSLSLWWDKSSADFCCTLYHPRTMTLRLNGRPAEGSSNCTREMQRPSGEHFEVCD